jgi:hypothetical protein
MTTLYYPEFLTTPTTDTLKCCFAEKAPESFRFLTGR